MRFLTIDRLVSTENFGGDPPIGSRGNYSDSHHHLPEGGDGRPLSWASETQGPGQAPFQDVHRFSGEFWSGPSDGF